MHVIIDSCDEIYFNSIFKARLITDGVPPGESQVRER